MPYVQSPKVIAFVKSHPPKRVGEYTERELQNIKTWPWPTWLVKTGEQEIENGLLLNAAIRSFGCEMNHENLNTMCQWSELTPLLNIIRPPEPHLITPEERTQGEEELAKIEKSWRGSGRVDGPDSAPFTVCYNSVENLDKIVAYVNKEFLGVAEPTSFLVAFRTLLSKGELTPLKKEQRPTHNAPATPSSIRAAREADAKKHADQRLTAQQLREMREQFKADYNTVDNYHGQGLVNGLRSHAAKYSGQKAGFEQLKAKWDGKFTGDDLKGYEEMMKNLEHEIEKLNPRGGTIKINDTNDRPNEYRGGGSI